MKELNFSKLFELVKDSTTGMYGPNSLRCNKVICDDYRNLLEATVGKDKVVEPLGFADICVIEDDSIPTGQIWAYDEAPHSRRVLGKLDLNEFAER